MSMITSEVFLWCVGAPEVQAPQWPKAPGTQWPQWPQVPGTQWPQVPGTQVPTTQIPVPQVEYPQVTKKPNECPAAPRYGHYGRSSRYCQDACKDDAGCPGVAKCCDSGCGKTCQNPGEHVFPRWSQCSRKLPTPHLTDSAGYGAFRSFR